jgi:Family of unknown function (DUF5681)
VVAKNTRNLKPWKPGESGNPSGRPKAAHGLRAALQARFGDDGEVLIDRLDRLAKLQGTRDRHVALAANELLLNYLAGKPTQRIEQTGPPVPMFALPLGDYPHRTND